MYRKSVCHLIFILSLAPLAGLSEPLRVGYGRYNAEPYTIMKGNQIEGGIIVDVMEAVADQLEDATLSYLNIPRKRQALSLALGDIHLIPIGNPKWENDPELYDWSIMLFQTRDVFVVSGESKFEIDKLEDLFGKRLGTILGYRYPELELMFENRTIFRENTKNLNSSFKMLQSNRVHAIINTDILVKYQLRSNPVTKNLVIANKTLKPDNIKMKISKRSPYTVEQLNAAIIQLKRDGVINRILSKYR